MIDRLHPSFQIMACEPGASTESLARLRAAFPRMPQEYVELAAQAFERDVGQL